MHATNSDLRNLRDAAGFLAVVHRLLREIEDEHLLGAGGFDSLLGEIERLEQALVTIAKEHAGRLAKSEWT